MKILKLIREIISPSLLPPLGVNTPLSPKITEAPPSIIKI
jgi:hypothetical protein